MADSRRSTVAAARDERDGLLRNTEQFEHQYGEQDEASTGARRALTEAADRLQALEEKSGRASSRPDA
jgi:hypothetical protein